MYMANSMSSKQSEHRFKHHSRRSCLPSCFPGSVMSDSDSDSDSDDDDARSTTRSSRVKASCFKKKIKKNLKQVSMESTLQGKGDKHELLEAGKNKQEIEHKRQEQLNDRSNSTKSGTDPVPTGTRTKHHGSAGPNQLLVCAKKLDRPSPELGHLVGLSIAAITLTMMIVWGRVYAVACLCACFCVVPFFRMTTTVTERSGGETKNQVKLDMDSKEYKKRVVLEGLLERKGHKLSTKLKSGQATATAGKR